MNRVECLKVIIDKSAEYPIIFTTGYTCRDAYNISDNKNHFYMVGSMGMAPSIGIGIALSNPKPVIIVDGDGSLLMNPSNLFIAKNLNLNNFIHIVLDNQVYESTGGQKTIASDFKFDEIAEAIGYRQTFNITSLEMLDSTLSELINNPQGPVLVLVSIEKNNGGPGGRIEIPLNVLANRFKNHICK